MTDLTEEEADKLLLTYDPISAMAQADKERLDALLASTQFGNNGLAKLLTRLAAQEGILITAKARSSTPRSAG